MVEEEIGCCATMQKWTLWIINILLFIFGVVELGVGIYLLSGGGGLEFISDLLDGNNQIAYAVLALGVCFIFLSFFGCAGAMWESKCLLWIYAVILFALIIVQAIVAAVGGVTKEYGKEIFEKLWKKLTDATQDDIQDSFKCCSYNGALGASWTDDNAAYASCYAANHNSTEWDPITSCWDKFEGDINSNFSTIVTVVSIALGVQIIIYFMTHFLIQKIAEAEGVEDGRGDADLGVPVV